MKPAQWLAAAGLVLSGTRKYMAWPTQFPFIFRIEVERLR